MKKLDKVFMKKKWLFKQVKRNNKAAIYEVRDEDSVIQSYEVFKIMIKPETNVFGVDYPEREVYPNDEQFGYGAYALREIEKAISIFNKLSEE